MKEIVKRASETPDVVRLELEKLYAEHKTDSAVKAVLDVSIGTLKRLKTMLTPKITPAVGGRTMGKKRPIRGQVVMPPPPTPARATSVKGGA